MTAWINEATSPPPESAAAATSRANARRADRLLRLLDLLLALALLLLLALPLVALHRRLVRSPVRGQGGRPFDRLGLRLPAGHTGRLLAALGAAHWPVLLNILRGDMAWVGPRARALDETLPAPCAALRPGLINPWFIRRRTAVDFGTEGQADLQYLARRGLRHDLGLLLRGVVVALLPPPAAAVPGRVQVGDVAFDNLGMAEAVARLRDMLDEGRAQQVSFVNPACVNVAARHRGYRRVLARAGLVLPDGIGIKIGADLLGTPLKQNVNGTDLFPRLCEMLQARGSRVFLLGGQPGAAEGVAAQIGQRWPGLVVAGSRHGFFSVAEEGEVAAQVRASGAEVLLVARGVPAQDLFIDRYLPLLGVTLALGVGGLFDFVSGRIARAPAWMRETGLEWVWRLLQEPGRMWQRYLVGNVTFLLRVALQRLGLRRPAADARPAPRPPPAAPDGLGVRAVIFATARAASDLPVAPDLPAALLPLGTQSVIEQLMARLAEAAVPEVDLVACDHPEALRALLGDGSRWGLRLRWHLVKDPTHPYAVLDNVALRGQRRLVIGHVDRCPAASALMRLAQCEQTIQQAESRSASAWSGWASVAPRHLPMRCADHDRDAFGAALQSVGLPARLAEAADGLALDSAAHLLDAQPTAGDGTAGNLADVPASWIRRPWGAMSPLAHVDAGAQITGPVLVGPGCIVERGARIGPHVVLSRNVIVSDGTQVADSLLLPGTYVGAGLALSQCIVHGSRVRHVALAVEAAPAESDALVLALGPGRSQRLAWPGRAMAAAALVLAGPALGAHTLLRRLAHRPLAWTLQPVVTGRGAGASTLPTAPLRIAVAHADARERGWALAAGLMDVALGRRRWFGMRPRSSGEWYALRPEWQQLLSGRAVGLLHAPAWSDDPALLAEARAAADVYAAVLSPLRRAGLMLGAAAGALKRPRRATGERARPAAAGLSRSVAAARR